MMLLWALLSMSHAVSMISVGPFPIHICGANKRPTPYALPLYDCKTLHKVNHPRREGYLNLLTGAHLSVPLDAYRCHAVISYTSCMEWFLGVKDIKFWTEGSVVSKEECQTLVEDRTVVLSQGLTSPRPVCIWWGNNTRSLRHVLLEPVTVFAHLLSDNILLPGHNSSWDFLSQSWHFSDAEYYFIPPSSIQFYNIKHRSAERLTKCSASEHRVSCPQEAITFWTEDLSRVEIKNVTYYQINPSLYVKEDLASHTLLGDHPGVSTHHRHGDPTTQYTLMRVSETREELIRVYNQMQCEILNLRKVTALALASINPVMAGLVYFGERNPGVSISQGGLVKYACVRVDQWEIDHTVFGYRDLPILYALPQYNSVMRGFLDSTSLYVKTTSVPGVPPQFLLINSTHLYNVHAGSYIKPLHQDIMNVLAEYPIRGVASYKEDELESLGALSHITEWLTRVTQPEDRRYEPNSHVVFALKDTPARDVVRTSRAWFSNLIPNTLSITAEIIGSFITIIIAIQLVTSGARWLNVAITNRLTHNRLVQPPGERME